jgi:glyoxylase-like metal-dependent hydrolase (beta-lactamase superfamily II)
MPHFLCTTCGTQFAETTAPPAACPICEDERQFVNPQGQRWTVLADLAADHDNVFRPQEPGLTGIGTEPRFTIGQRALLVQAAGGNVLWDCVSLIDDATVRQVNDLGGLSAVAISHPHYYSSMVEWSRAFGGVPIYLHAADRQWVMRPDPAVVFWQEETLRLGDDLALIRCGGHFAGGTVLHWPAGAGGRGALLSGDILQVCPDRKHVSFMYSYPNYIPLNAAKVQQVVDAVTPFAFDRIYGAWWDNVIPADGKSCIDKSLKRYIRAISE